MVGEQLSETRIENFFNIHIQTWVCKKLHEVVDMSPIFTALPADGGEALGISLKFT